MRPLILCRERLGRIRRVLEQCGGTATVRELWRSHTISAWEIEQAAAMGWFKVSIRKPRVGRPSRVVEFCGLINVKFPDPRWCIEKEISIRHWWFAWRSVHESVKHGMRRWGLPGIFFAYLKTYHPRSRNGAYASASRLLKRADVRAARQWFYAQSSGELPPGETMPTTASGIRMRLRELGSRRADYY